MVHSAVGLAGVPFIGIPRGIVGVSVVHVEFVLRGLSFGWWSLFRWSIFRLVVGVSLVHSSVGLRGLGDVFLVWLSVFR